METPETGTKSSVLKFQSSNSPTVSIVIPAFNEAERIGSSLQQIFSFLDRNALSAEIIVVDDGSADRTPEIAMSFKSERLQVISNDVNRGKGYSVRKGFLQSKGTWVLFTDSDLSAPIEEVNELLRVAANGIDVVIGSRALDRSKIEKHQPWPREFGGIVYNWAVRLILRIAVKDTQCGLKLFHRERMKCVFQKQTIFGFGFDPELLFLAAKLNFEIREIAVSWSHNDGSKVNFINDGLRMVLDLIRIRINWMIGKYR